MSLDLRRREGSLFASKSLALHSARGLFAGLLFYAAVNLQATHAWASLAAGVAALVALRGCPICWSIGLVETISTRKAHHPNLKAENVLPAITSRKST
jgi:hypothetical protein